VYIMEIKILKGIKGNKIYYKNAKKNSS